MYKKNHHNGVFAEMVQIQTSRVVVDLLKQLLWFLDNAVFPRLQPLSCAHIFVKSITNKLLCTMATN